MIICIGLLLFFSFFMILAYHRASLPVWSVGCLVFLVFFSVLSQLSLFAFGILIVIYALIFGFLNCKKLRCLLISSAVLKLYRRLMPSLSPTEKTVLESGTVGWEADLLGGMPDWSKFSCIPLVELSEEEREFLRGPVETLCQSIDDWTIARSMKVPANVWDFLKSAGFFGMNIPKLYGGKAFSALGCAQVISKVASVSTTLATIVSVPNSLGPAELILRYGTDKQKQYYLPRLAAGQEIPCFALTSEAAGSDATAITDTGVVCRSVFDGQEQLCLRLNWDKRYITLSPIATLIGLAFKCHDPNNLLGNKQDLGITCALVPSHLEGVVTGRRHFPLHSAFPNGPTQGKDVIIPLEWVIGGPSQIGQGWWMLMECLITARAIALPAIVAGGARSNLLLTSAYTRIRQQFHASLSCFEGVQAILARMAARTYMIEAVRAFNLSALNHGKMPVVASAINKYHVTEWGRSIINDAMDLHGGKGICMGPRNYLAQNYIESPISITVEGANILTRSLMIYGQGLIRCHPYLLSEMRAASSSEQAHSLRAFDRVFFSHLGLLVSNTARAFCLGLSKGRGTWSPPQSPLKRYYQLLTRFSAGFSLLSDVVMMSKGARLKQCEMLSARLGDILSFLYITSAVLKYYEHYQVAAEQPLAQWACEELLSDIQKQLYAVIGNIPQGSLRFFLRILIFPVGGQLLGPSDALSKTVAALLTQSGPVRDRFLALGYRTSAKNNRVFQMESALEKVILAEPIEKKLRKIKNFKAGLKDFVVDLEARVTAALSEQSLSQEEADQLLAAYRARSAVIQVDDFDEDEI